MSFLKHEQISLQKYSMLKIVQDKHLLKTLVATLIRIRRSKEVATTAPTPKILAIVLSVLVYIPTYLHFRFVFHYNLN
jgi:hypothetical protein